MSTRPGNNAAKKRPCVRQNRVVLAVVATVKLFAEVKAGSTGRAFASFRESEGGQNELGSRESTA